MSEFTKQSSWKNIPPLQTIVQLNVYRWQNGQFEYLLLRRIDADSKFWQVITEPVSSSSTLGDTLRQAAHEQAGLRGVKHLSDETYSYEWYTHGERGRDIVFAVEVSTETNITLDQHRFAEFAWMSLSDAIHHLKWDGNRTALKKLEARLQKERETAIISFPSSPSQRQPYTPGTNNGNSPTPDTPSTSPPANPTLAQATGPYSPNVPRRLPDVPDTVAATPKEVNPGEFFL
jgi:hypothetical protein